MPGYIGRDHLHTYACTRGHEISLVPLWEDIFLFRLEITSVEITV